MPLYLDSWTVIEFILVEALAAKPLDHRTHYGPILEYKERKAALKITNDAPAGVLKVTNGRVLPDKEVEVAPLRKTTFVISDASTLNPDMTEIEVRDVYFVREAAGFPEKIVYTGQISFEPKGPEDVSTAPQNWLSRDRDFDVYRVVLTELFNAKNIRKNGPALVPETERLLREAGFL